MDQFQNKSWISWISGHLPLLLILLLAALLRVHDLDGTSLWYDEAVSWDQSRGSFANLLSAVATDNYPPLHNIVLWITMPVLGDSETALRLPSALLGVAAVWLTYLVGRRLGGREVGLLAAALLALSPFHIWYSTEARMYALLATCGLGFLLCVVEAFRPPTLSWLIGVAVMGALFLYSHIYALLGFAAVGLTVAACLVAELARGKSLRSSAPFRICLAMGVSCLAFLPWLVILLERARSVAETGFWIAYPNWPFLKHTAFSVSGSLVLFGLLVALALFGVLRIGKPVNGQRNATSSVLLVCLAYTAGPPVLAYLYSVTVQPILFDRYLIAAWPGLLLLASLGAHRLMPVVAPLALTGLAIYLSFPELKFTLTEKVRPEWRLIAQDYEEKRASQDGLVLYKGFAAPALTYYLREPGAFKTAEDVTELQGLGEHERWLLVVHSNEAETAAAIEAFQAEGSQPASRRFGWGASGLSLLEKPLSN